MGEKEKLRLDKYLWSIRIFKTRSQASVACDKGKVKMDGNSLKASKIVQLGEVYEIKTENRKWVIKVTGLLDHRVQFTEAIKFFEDQTPEEEKLRLEFQAAVFFTGKRQTKIGRPTKKQRRELDDFME
ncbi:MAG: RNA-binding S4 domain-containing protein [Chitinophagaceae bacterium]